MQQSVSLSCASDGKGACCASPWGDINLKVPYLAATLIRRVDASGKWQKYLAGLAGLFVK